MLQEVDLASLSVLIPEPIGVRELLTKETIASVWVANLGGFGGIRERFLVNSVELVHELSSEDRDSYAHDHKVCDYYVLNHKC